MNKDFIKEKEFLLSSIENNTQEHWFNYYKDVPISCIFDDLVIDINEIKRLTEENKQLKEQLEYIRSGEYYNQLRFERNMLQDLVDKGGISKEEKKFIDCTHRNTELLEIIDKALEFLKKYNSINDWEESMYNELLNILQERK